MNEKRIIDMMQRIEKYILGKLTQKEIDQLWIEFLKDPEWLKITETEINLRALGRKKINVSVKNSWFRVHTIKRERKLWCNHCSFRLYWMDNINVCYDILQNFTSTDYCLTISFLVFLLTKCAGNRRRTCNYHFRRWTHWPHFYICGKTRLKN